jgi:hypothetical protein
METSLIRQEAERFRRLAASIRDLDLRQRLLTMADRLDLQAMRLEEEEASPRRRRRTRAE